jgi:hypothetical protein
MTARPSAAFFQLTLDDMKKMNGLKINELTPVQLERLIQTKIPMALRFFMKAGKNYHSQVGYIKDYEVGRRFGKIIYIVADMVHYDQSVMMDTDDVDLNRFIVFEDWMDAEEKSDLKAFNQYLKKNPEAGVVRNFCENCGNLANKYFEEEEGGDGNHFCDPCAQHFINEQTCLDGPAAIEGDILQLPEEARIALIAAIQDQYKKAGPPFETRGGCMPMVAATGATPVDRFDKPHDWQQSLREAEAGSRLVNKPFISDLNDIDLTKDSKNG